MIARRFRLRYLLLPLLLAMPAAGQAQAPTRAEAAAALAPRYSAEELDQMLAPIALYPDQLLIGVLTAATYPDQLAAAAQWLQQPNNAALQGDALVNALAPLPWDAGVKSLVALPQVVAMMNAHPDWTAAIGLAFADQQVEVMARVQALRLQALNAGRLRQAPHLRILRQGAIIVIEPADPDVVYVPLYNPAVMYGRWRYRDHPPVYLPPPPGFAGYPAPAAFAAWIGFGVAHRVAAPLWRWSRPNWREHRVTINAPEYTRISHNRPPPRGGIWRHAGPVTAIARPAPSRPTAAAPHPPGTAAATAVLVPRPGLPARPTTKLHPAPPAFERKPAPPVAHPAPPVAHPAPPVAHPAPPAFERRPAPPVAHPAPPVAHPAPPVAHPAPPAFERRPAPPVAHPAPPHPAPPVAHPAPPHPAPPQPAKKAAPPGAPSKEEPH